MNRPAKVIAIGIAVVVGSWLCHYWWVHRNPYSSDGLHAKWTFWGATSSVPGLDVWADYRGRRIECPLVFGGIESPDLQFRDYDGDGRRDIVVENDSYKQVVAFIPASGDAPPQFKVIRNDVTWP
ncbi:MAG: hypothetical protein RL088_1882 [Verrucomicrobiota bacterium]|jgi:hypothetical protein